MSKKRFVFYAVVVLGLFSIVHSQGIVSLFADTGKTALSQKRIDIHGGAVILSLAIAPGFEDVATLAYYRLKYGAVTPCVYLTNGEDIPNYERGSDPLETAKQRKEEAYSVMQALQSEAYFLNIPAQAFVSSDTNAMRMENQFLKLDKIIADVKPDIILLHSDYIFPDASSKRLRVIEKNIEMALQRLKAKSQWHEVSVFAPSGVEKQGERVSVDEVNALVHHSYTDIAQTIKRQYKSMALILSEWEKHSHSCYSVVYPHDAMGEKLAAAGIPIIPQHVSQIAAKISELSRHQNALSRDVEYSRLHEIVSRIDGFVNSDQQYLSLREKRMLLYWKNTVESYRCALHNVLLPLSVMDSNVTSLQVLFIKIGSLASWPKTGKTELLFPGVIQKEWIVDTRQDYSYPLRADTSWLVVTPKKFPLTSTDNNDGYHATQARNYFAFMAAHEEEKSDENFVYQKNIPLVGTPHQSLEVLTPYILANNDSAIIVRIKNYLFNAMDGELSAEDSILKLQPYHIHLAPKSMSLDTLPLIWKNVCPEGSFQIALLNRKHSVAGSFVYKGLALKMGVKRPVGVYSAIKNSPLREALHRIGYQCIYLDSMNQERLAELSVILLDEQSSGMIGSHTKNRLQDWVRAGGRLIILPQYGLTSALVPDDSVAFCYQHPTISIDDVVADTLQKIFLKPNLITITNWRDTTSFVAYGDLEVKNYSSVAIPVRSNVTHRPLLVVRPYDKGTVIYCAFNLYPQLLTIQANAYKFLVNILNN